MAKTFYHQDFVKPLKQLFIKHVPKIFYFLEFCYSETENFIIKIVLAKTFYFQDLGKHCEAITHFQKAAELQKQSALDCLTSLGLMASCQILSKDHDGALAVLTEMAQIAEDRGGTLY